LFAVENAQREVLSKYVCSHRAATAEWNLERELAMIDDQVAENCPPVSEKFEQLYAKLYSPK